MSNLNENFNVENTLTKKDLRKSLHRYILARQAPFNYETMQSGGFVYAIQPILEKLYEDPAVIAEKQESYFKFYNTMPFMGNLILPTIIAVEQVGGEDATKTDLELRTALMGPLAGLGDSIIFILPMTILGAIAGYMALDGSVLGFLIGQAVFTTLWVLFYKLFYVAYEKGISFVTDKSEQLNNLTQAAAVIALSVVGVLIFSTVKVKTGIELNYGEVSQSLDALLGSIIPNFLNIVAIVLIYIKV